VFFFFFRWGLTLCPGWPGHEPSIYTSSVTGMTDTCHHTQLLTEMGTMILPISTSQRARIIGMCHCLYDF
jgi:hypothetical protein